MTLGLIGRPDDRGCRHIEALVRVIELSQVMVDPISSPPRGLRETIRFQCRDCEKTWSQERFG